MATQPTAAGAEAELLPIECWYALAEKLAKTADGAERAEWVAWAGRLLGRSDEPDAPQPGSDPRRQASRIGHMQPENLSVLDPQHARREAAAKARRRKRAP